MVSESRIDKIASVGIDLGTTYSSFSYAAVRVSNSMPVAVPQLATDMTGSRLEHQFIPSLVCVYLEENMLKWAVGEEALDAAEQYGDSAHLYHAFKLFLGYSLPATDRNIRLPKSDPNGRVVDVDPGELAKRLISYMKDLAFGSTGSLEGFDISSISVSVPALWPEDRKLYIENIVQEVFPNVKVRSLEEPIAALYHQINAPNASHLLTGNEKFVLVIDYGGGTCDVAVVKVNKDADRLQAESSRVAEVVGRGSLERGGLVLDLIISREIIRPEAKRRRIDLSKEQSRHEAESMKIVFSNKIRDTNAGESSLLVYEAFRQFRKFGIQIKSTKKEFAHLLDQELSQIEIPMKQALNNATDAIKKEVTFKDIQHVFLAGGTTLLPLVKDKVSEIFISKGAPISITDQEPRFAIAFGNALHAYHFDTGTGFRIGITLQENIWLEGYSGIGILLAKKGTALPYHYRNTPFVLGKMPELKIGLYRGNHRIVADNELISAPIKLPLTKPTGGVTFFKVDVTIHESGIMDFRITRRDHSIDQLNLQKRVPVRSDVEEMRTRAGLSLIEEGLK